MLLEPGRLVGAYEILEPLGRGGMGEVYRARHTRLGMLAAIKVVSGRLESDPDASERLKREARLASSLNHPAIVTIHDIGEIEGRTFIVMEFVDGEPLSARLATGPMKEREAVELASQLADGLAAAHGADVVHRDLKPQNIMVTPDGRVKIVDFGLSKMAPLTAGAEDETKVQPANLTAPHTVLGSAGYMAPEQVSGRPVTFRTDQFALGVVLYEMLTGQRAFRGDTAMDTLAAILRDEPTPIGEICPTLSPRLVTIIDRCLAKRPENRYGSTRDLARDLTEVRDQPTSRIVPRPSGPQPTPRSRRWAATGVLLALAVTGAFAYWKWIRVPPPPGSGIATRQLVAVLPFVCADANEEVFCDGLEETLTIDLARLSSFDPGLRVVSQEVLRRDLPPDKAGDPKIARGALGATVSIRGDVVRRGSDVAVTLVRVDAGGTRSRLLNVAHGAASMRREFVTAAAVLLDVKLSRSFGASLLAWWNGHTFASSAPIDAGGTSVPEAYDAYVRGRGYLHRGKESAEQAVAFLGKAVQSDPTYALAHAALCDAYRLNGDKDRARASCLDALRIDATLALAHLTLARIASGDHSYGEAVASARRAVDLDPLNSDEYHELGAAYEADWQRNNLNAEATYREALKNLTDDPQAYRDLCRFYLVKGRDDDRRFFGQAELECRHAAALMPDNPRVLNNLGATLFYRQNLEEGAVFFQHSWDVSPTFNAAAGLGYYAYQRGQFVGAARRYEDARRLNPTHVETLRSLGTAYWASGSERAKSRGPYEEVVRLILLEQGKAPAGRPLDPKLLGQLADAYSMLDRKPEARAALGELERLPVADAETLFTIGNAYAQIGDRSRAFYWLKRAIDAGYPRDQANRSPFLTELRKDPRYAGIVK